MGPRHPESDRVLVAALEAVGTGEHLRRLVDLVASLVWHDRVTVTRYAAGEQPKFLLHRNFSDSLVRRYLAVFYPFDPFYVHWCQHRTAGVLPLSRFGSRELKNGRYIAEFLAQSAISDEAGVLLQDGPGAAIGIFLERATRTFSEREIARLEAAFPAVAAIHDLHGRMTGAEADRPIPSPRQQPPSGRRPAGSIPAALWPELTGRERELVGLVLAGHPPQAIAARLGISAGTVRNHRLSIYRKLDITTEREVFLQYLEYLSVSGTGK